MFHFNSSNDRWPLQSILNFKIWQIVHITFALMITILSYYSIRGRFMNWFYLVIGFAFFMIARYYILWYKSGFDHYPGFDPYLF